MVLDNIQHTYAVLEKILCSPDPAFVCLCSSRGPPSTHEPNDSEPGGFTNGAGQQSTHATHTNSKTLVYSSVLLSSKHLLSKVVTPQCLATLSDRFDPETF